MPSPVPTLKDAGSVEEALELVSLRAVEMFHPRTFLCAETMVLVLGKTFGLDTASGSGPSLDSAVRLARGWSQGMGGAGCTCGALNGGIMAMGLVLDDDNPRRVRKRSKVLHDRFKDQYGTVCCRDLGKGRGLLSGGSVPFCKDLTGVCAALAAGILLETDPTLAQAVDWEFLRTPIPQPKTRLGSWLGKGKSL
jgi:C_GCAxxG_C_C family probable redox protein